MGAWDVQIDTSGGRVAFSRELLASVAERAEAGYRKMAWGGVEIGGLLLGRRGDAAGTMIAVEEAVEAACEHEFGPSFHLSARDLEALATQIAAVPEGQVVGWWLTSSRDLALAPETTALLDRYFFQPWHVVLAVQRGRNVPTRMCVYRGGLGKRVAGGVMDVAAALAEAPLTEAPAPPVTAPQAAVEDAERPAQAAGPAVREATRAGSNNSFYPSPQHREAVAVLERGIRARRGVMVLVGEAGTGKTAVLEALTGKLEQDHADFSLLRNPRLTVDELFELLAYDLKLQAIHTRKVAVLFAMQQRAAQLAQAGQTLGLIFDDAHLLSRELLLEIELLENIETRWGKLLQIVLSGRPELHKRLAEPDHLGLRQRVSLQARVSAFDAEQTAGYALHRFAGKAGVPPWEPGFVADLQQLSQGLPRLINVLCGQVEEETERRGEPLWTRALLHEVAG